MVQATLLADALAEHPDDAVARAVAYEAGREREIRPWYRGLGRPGPPEPGRRPSEAPAAAEARTTAGQPASGAADAADDGRRRTPRSTRRPSCATSCGTG